MSENGRTHEPSLREITVQIDGLERLYDERDRRYADRFNAQESAFVAALAAQERLTAAAFAASKEAMIKAEAMQSGVNERGNELRAQAATLMPRRETEAMVAGIREALDRQQMESAVLRNSQSEASGRRGHQSEARQSGQWAMGAAIAIAGVAISAAYLLTHLRALP